MGITVTAFSSIFRFLEPGPGPGPGLTVQLGPRGNPRQMQRTQHRKHDNTEGQREGSRDTLQLNTIILKPFLFFQLYMFKF